MPAKLSKNFYRKFGTVFDLVPSASQKSIKWVEKIVYIVEPSLRKYINIYPMIFNCTTMRMMPAISTRFIEHFGYSFENILYGMESTLVFDKKKILNAFREIISKFPGKNVFSGMGPHG